MHRIQDKQHIAAEVMTQYHNYTVTFNYSAAHLDPYLFVSAAMSRRNWR